MSRIAWDGCSHSWIAPAKACRLLYRGDVAGKETKLLTATFAAGLLQQAMESEVNMVNAEVLFANAASSWSSSRVPTWGRSAR